MISSHEGVEIMQDVYGIIVKQAKRENYGFPYKSLETIDEIMTSNKKADLIAKLKEENIIPYLTDECDIAVGIVENKKWLERKIIPTITDKEILTFPFEEIFMKYENECSLCLYNQLIYLVDKNYVSLEFKNALLSLKKDAKTFINLYKTLPYVDRRLLRYTLFKNLHLVQENNILLKRTINE